MSKHTQILVSLTAAALLLAIPSAARASLDACGGVQLSVGDECEVVPEETCTVQCDKDAMDTACAADLYDDCEEQCEPAPDPKCVETCEEVCMPTCQDQEQSCQRQAVAVLCVSSCTDDCSVDCADSGDKGQCDATCRQTCGEVCEKYEDDNEPACEPRCAVACEGTCQAQAATQCQVTCQSQKSAECKARMADECDEECTKTGAVFCEGQYLAAAVVEECTDQLHAELAIDVKNVQHRSNPSVADLSGASDGTNAGADDDQTAGCMSTIDARGGLGGALMALGIVGLAIARRRRDGGLRVAASDRVALTARRAARPCARADSRGTSRGTSGGG